MRRLIIFYEVGKSVRERIGGMFSREKKKPTKDLIRTSGEENEMDEINQPPSHTNNNEFEEEEIVFDHNYQQQQEQQQV